MSSNERNGLVRTLAGGLKDVPRNASWLVGKAFTHDSSASNGTHGSNGNGSSSGSNGVVATLSHAGRALKES